MASDKTQSRLHLVDPAQIHRGIAEGVTAFPLDNLERVMANADTLFPAYLVFIGAILERMNLDPDLVRLIIMFVAKESDCFYIWRHYVIDARNYGVSQAQIDSFEICDIEPTLFSKQQRVAFRFVHEAMFLVEVTDATFAETKKYFTDRAITEMLYVVGAYMCLCRVARTGRVPLDELPSLALSTGV